MMKNLFTIVFILTMGAQRVVAQHPFSLDSVAKRTFHYFWDLPDAHTQIPDRWPSPSFSSIAATGFGLTAYLVGVERHYITREQAAERVYKTLEFLVKAPKGDGKKGIAGYRGFFYHFLDSKSGLRFGEVELSTVDTGLLMAGILSCEVYFDGNSATEKQIKTWANQLFREVDWTWAMNNDKTMSMGWHPERGFIDARWRGYNEGSILYIMALGSPTHTISPDCWQAWTKSFQWSTYHGQEHVNFGPLFGHQYSHMYIDFKGIQDDYMRQKGIDYFENSRRATYANRDYCKTNAAGYKDYSESVWGLTACDGPGNDSKQNPNISFMGYNARGAAEFYLVDDGTIAPTAAGGSIPFAPEICIPALQQMYERYGTNLYGKYGFKDAFNMSIAYNNGTVGWFDKDYLGIDQGPIIIQIQNYQNQFVWNLMKKSPYIREGLKCAGFSGGWLNQ